MFDINIANWSFNSEFSCINLNCLCACQCVPSATLSLLYHEGCYLQNGTPYFLIAADSLSQEAAIFKKGVGDCAS